MGNKLLLISIAIMVSMLSANCISSVRAMGKRPVQQKEAKSQAYVLPEIEIITKPETNIELLAEENNELQPNRQVSPEEVLPAVVNNAKTSGKQYAAVEIQKALIKAGFDIGSCDGKIGPKTKKAIKDFQKQNSLTIDGIVGAKTWAKLKTHLNSSETNKKN
ncbi:MAG: peptidoglycan-binding protein [Candidatus Omnitrophica bacterium]|nr:peptidoglycan-binding protein [Candidatus Omnitrophota bacterium]